MNKNVVSKNLSRPKPSGKKRPTPRGLLHDLCSLLMSLNITKNRVCDLLWDHVVTAIRQAQCGVLVCLARRNKTGQEKP